MNLSTQFVNFNVDSDLKDFISKKVSVLEKYHPKITDVELFLKVEKTSEKENKQVEIKVNIPHKQLFVKKESKTFEQAILLSLDSMKRQLKKCK